MVVFVFSTSQFLTGPCLNREAGRKIYYKVFLRLSTSQVVLAGPFVNRELCGEEKVYISGLEGVIYIFFIRWYIYIFWEAREEKGFYISVFSGCRSIFLCSGIYIRGD